MHALLALAGAIDRLTAFIGKAVSWLILLAILVSAANAISRKAFSIASNASLELQWYLFGAAFLLAAAYTLQRDEHIRIDIVSSSFKKRTRDWIDVFGHVFALLPFAGFMIYECAPFFWTAYVSGEVSGSFGGLPLWPANLVILAGFVLLFVQGLSELIKRVAIMRGLIADPRAARDELVDRIE